MKLLLTTLLILSLPALIMSMWASRSRMARVRERARLALQLLAVVYLGSFAYRLASYAGEGQQVMVVGVAFGLLGAIWLTAWIVTRVIAKKR